MKFKFTLLFLIIGFSAFSFAQIQIVNPGESKPGAWQTEEYLPALLGKNVAVIANQTSTIGKTHLVDSLLKRKVNIKKVFGPEHGFRGQAANGEEVNDDKDQATGLPVERSSSSPTLKRTIAMLSPGRVVE